ncbi:MAG: ATP synthase F0 sector subunit c, partial [uncultured Sphingomonas sp.]
GFRFRTGHRCRSCSHWRRRRGRRRGQRLRLVPRKRAAQPGRCRQPAGPPVHRLRGRRAARPDRVRRRDDHPLRAL